jgi:DsbC/DsbD-like thiol-disulfide interchange protein
MSDSPFPRRFRSLSGRTACAIALAAQIGLCQSAPPSHAKVELIADVSSPAARTTWVGLLFHLDQGWHIYWQNAGDSGTPPKVEWHLPAGYRAGAIRWPQPVRLGSGSVIDYGYEDHVLLMTPIDRATNSTAAVAVPIAADVKYVVCREVCIPGKMHLSLALSPVGDPPSEASAWHALFQKTRARLPNSPPASWRVSATSEKDHFVLSLGSTGTIKSATFFPMESGQIENSAPQSFASTGDGFRLTLKKSDQLVQPISTLRGLIVLGPGRAFEIAAPVAR